MAYKVASVVDAPRMGRANRDPSHRFQLRHKPFQIQPFLLAPVLPGETLKSAQIQSRVVTKPINNPLIGWWQEYYFFYVKHRDLDGRDDFTAMMLDLDHSMAAYKTAAVVNQYHAANSFNWVEMCLKRVVEEYFRDEDEAWDANDVDGLPLAAVNSDSFLNSAVLNDNFVLPEDEELTVGVDDKITASEVDNMLRTWQFQRMNGLTPMDYEDWLATYGVRSAPAESHRPELLRYLRQWQYPSNIVDPSTGVPSSAVSWSMNEQISKNRFFREPGFIFGVTVTRPKVYFRNLTGNMADWMMDALTWLPAIMRDDPYTSMKKFLETEGPASGVVTDADGYWIDIKDLFLYGDQFVNFSIAADNTASAVALPSASLNSRYIASTDIDNLFPGADKYVAQDGIVNLNIAGALVETTPARTGSVIA